ncbi:MAG: putative lipoprotein [Frankiales bacterium]|nr:putative lipoprotein [Frankiales bacterium]
MVLASLAGLVAVAAVAAPLAEAIAPVRQGTDTRVVLPSGRAYVLHTPPQLRAHPGLAEGRPVLLFLAGLGVGVAESARSTGFNRLSDRDGRLVAYAEGIRGSFNAGLCCGDAAATEVDDMAFLSAVVSNLKMRGAGRIAAVGFSNGGMMAFRLACERPELVDAVGSMSGTLEIPRCRGPVRALVLNGELDRVVPPGGLRYSSRLKCFLRDVRTIPGAAPGSAITIKQLAGVPHRWTQSKDPVDATQEFWQFAGLAA